MRKRGRHIHDDDMEIVYEDEWLVVVDKPSGLLSMSTGKGIEDTAYSRLYDHVLSHKKHASSGRVFIVHRLDRDTSGLLIFAKDHDTKIALQENWDDAVLERRYHAVLEGHIEDEGWIDTWLYENPKSMKVHCFPFDSKDNPDKPPRKGWVYASTHCKAVGHRIIEGREYTEVIFNLETGRKNQIRVHSQWIGHPIAGDRKYGAESNPFGRLALHAEGLSIIHPWTGKKMKFTSTFPRIFRKP